MATPEAERSCCCCQYCYHWKKDEEEAAQVHIKRSAQTSLCGKLFCCNYKWLYNRHTVQKGYCFLSIMLCVFPLWIIIYANVIYYPAEYINSFKTTKCSVTKIEFNENTTSSCTWSNSDQETSGTRHYKCVQITVSFQPTDRNYSKPRNFTTVIADGYYNLKNYGEPVKCTTRPTNCHETGDLEHESRAMKSYFEDYIGNNLFDCLYNPMDYQEVVLEGYHDMEGAVKHLIGVGVGLALTISLLLFMCCTCGCLYIWSNKVPRSIHAAIEKEVSSVPSPSTPLAPTRSSAPATNDMTIHVDKPMRVVPVDQYMGGTVPDGAILLVPVDSFQPPNPEQGAVPMTDLPPPYSEHPEPENLATVLSAPDAKEVKGNPPC